MAVAESQAILSNALRLVAIEGKGRGLVASQPLKRGQIVLQDSPILAYSAFPLKRRQPQEGGSCYSRYCAHCYRCLVAGAAMLTCPSCSHPDDGLFCSPECQSLALSSTHTPWVCRALSQLRNCPLLVDGHSDGRQVLARYLVAAYNLSMVSPAAFQTLLSLDGGRTQGGEQEAEVALFLHSVMSSLPFPEGVSPPSVEITMALLAKDRCNAFRLMDHKERSVIGYAIYPNASFFNHDCIPNGVAYSDSAIDVNTDIIIQMRHDVPQGREICLSYIPDNISYSERQRWLLEEYGFTCLCFRCRVEERMMVLKTRPWRMRMMKIW